MKKEFMKELKHIAFQLNVLIEDYYRNQEETEDREVEGIQNTQMEDPINKIMDEEAIKMAKKIDEEKYDFVWRPIKGSSRNSEERT